MVENQDQKGRGMGLRNSCLGALAAALLGACSVIPVAGPESWDIKSGRTELPYALVELNPKVVTVLASNAPRIAGAIMDRRGPQMLRLGVGDIVAVTVYETGAGLFVPNDTGVRPGNFFVVPQQAVGTDGNISVPSAGTI